MNIEAVDAAMSPAQRQRVAEIGQALARLREEFHSATATFDTRRANIAETMRLSDELGSLRRQAHYEMFQKA